MYCINTCLSDLWVLLHGCCIPFYSELIILSLAGIWTRVLPVRSRWHTNVPPCFCKERKLERQRVEESVRVFSYVYVVVVVVVVEGEGWQIYDCETKAPPSLNLSHLSLSLTLSLSLSHSLVLGRLVKTLTQWYLFLQGNYNTLSGNIRWELCKLTCQTQLQNFNKWFYILAKGWRTLKKFCSWD